MMVMFFSDAQKNGLLNWVASGKGYVGVHSAADSFRTCPEYRAMVGGHFVTHPRYRDYQVSIVDPEHTITEDMSEFMVRDEQYILDYDLRNHVLCSALYEGGAMPVAWTKSWGEEASVPACRSRSKGLLLIWRISRGPMAFNGSGLQTPAVGRCAEGRSDRRARSCKPLLQAVRFSGY